MFGDEVSCFFGERVSIGLLRGYLFMLGDGVSEQVW